MDSAPHRASPATISSRPFGNLPDGAEVDAWTLRNANGIEVEILTYGGIIRKILLPDGAGNLADVVLGFDSLEDYLGEHPYFGAVVGRVAGRIAGGSFQLGEDTYPLDCNDPPNHLHGGPNSIDRKVWKAESSTDSSGNPILTLCCQSPHGENGYPGNLDLTVRYSLTSANELIFETEARSDRTTPVSLTQHAYWNLAGEGSGTIHEHKIQINSEETFAVDSHMTLLDSLETVEGTARDFRDPVLLRDAIPNLFEEHGDLYWLGESEPLRPVARVEDPTSGRVLEVATDLPCLQFYTSVSLDGSLVGKAGQSYPPFSGLCLECEGYPQAMGSGPFGNILVSPDKPQTSCTIYTFSTDSTLSGR